MSRARKSSETICPDRFCRPPQNSKGREDEDEEEEEEEEEERKKKGTQISERVRTWREVKKIKKHKQLTEKVQQQSKT